MSETLLFLIPLLPLVCAAVNMLFGMRLPRLSQYGVSESGLDQVVAHSRGSSMKTNPVLLHDAEIRAILLRRL